MKKNIVRYIALALLFHLVACSFFGTEIIEIPPQKPQIAIFAEIFNDKELNQSIILSRTRNLNEKIFWNVNKGDTIYFPQSSGYFINYIEFDSVLGARIKLTSNNLDVANFKQNDPFYKSFYESNIAALQEGSKCTLQVSAPNFDTIFGEQFVPKSAKLMNAKFTRNSFKSFKTGTLSELSLEFENHPNSVNYYAIDIYIKKTNRNDYYYFKPKLIKIDPNADTPEFLNSKNFNSKRYIWRIGIDLDGDFINNPNGDPNKPIPIDIVNIGIRFRSTNKDFNEYSKYRETVNNATDNLFGEPITPFSNIKNGVGIFIVSGKPDTMSVSIR
jgi:Domain of unknown function (DUF4249)